MARARVINTRNLTASSIAVERMFANWDYMNPLSNNLDNATRIGQVITHCLNKMGIQQVYSKVNRLYRNDLRFSVITLLIRPNIDNLVSKTNHPEMVSFLQNKFRDVAGYDRRISNVRINALFDTKVKRIMINNFPIADFYPSRNLLIVNFNMFPYQDLRLSAIKAACDFLQTVLVMNDVKIAPSIISVKEMEKQQKDKLLKSFLKNIEQSIKTKKRRITEMSYDVVLLNSRVVENYKNILSYEKELEALEVFKPGRKEALNKEIKDIQELKFVKNVDFTVDGILIDVGKLSMVCNKEKVFIGEISFVIRHDGIKIKNKNSNGQLQHPHVKHEQPCLGSHSTGINKLLGELHLKRLVFTLYQFLNTYTHSGTFGGSTLSAWKTFRKKEGKYDGEGNILGTWNKEKPTIKRKKKSKTTIFPEVNHEMK